MDTTTILKERLAKYPSSFETLTSMKSVSNLKCNINKLVSELDELEKTTFYVDEYTTFEKVRLLNMISLLWFALGETKKALYSNKEALDKDKTNVNALANNAWYCLESMEFVKSRQQIDELEQIKPTAIDILIARGEIAFTYSRLGMTMYKRAEEIYYSVLGECNHVSDGTVPEEYICMWKFGLALAIHRQIHFHNSPNIRTTVSKERLQSIIRLLLEITKLNKVAETIARYRARSFAELGMIVYEIEKGEESRFTGGVKYFFPIDETPQSCDTDRYFEKALAIEVDDVFVLERSGKYYRYRREHNKAIKHLKIAIQLRETSFAHHHLALALKGKTRLQNKHVSKPNSSKNTNLVSKPESVDQQKISNMLKMIKSPRYVCSWHDDNKNTKLIFYHLDRAWELNENTEARYDTGLMHRSLRHHDEALEVFKTLISCKKTSPVLRLNCYEQSAFCLLDKRNETKELKEKELDALEYDAIIFLEISLEVSSSFLSQMPYLKGSLAAFSVLEKMLLEQPEGTQQFKRLGNLYAKQEKYKETIEQLKKARNSTEDEKETIGIITEIIKAYEKEGKYQEAIQHLKTLLLLKNGYDKTDDHLFWRVHVKGGISSLKTGDTQMAYLRFKDALNFGRQKEIHIDDSMTVNPTFGVYDPTTADTFDVIILCDPDSEEMGISLQDKINKTGLRTTLNWEDVIPGHNKLTGTYQVMKECSHCVIVQKGSEKNDPTPHLIHFSDFFKSIQEEKYGKAKNLVIVVEDRNTSIFPIWKAYPSITFCPDVAGEAETNDEFDWIQDFLLKLASGKDDVHDSTQPDIHKA